MEYLARGSPQRTTVIFVLILATAMLWAVFLLSRGEMLLFMFMVAGLAVINPIVAYTTIHNKGETRTLVFFYLIVLTGMLWSVFLLVFGIQLWISFLLFLVAVGVPFIVHTLHGVSAGADISAE